MTAPLPFAVQVGSDLHELASRSHPKLDRGRVWCRTCGASLVVNPAECLRSGWPKCCGQTMTIDAPSEREDR